jgi:NADH-quinone oxidoreductase subunit F
VDLHLIPSAVPSSEERAAIDAALGAAVPGRQWLLPALHAAQSRAGWISEGALNYICERLSVAPADAYGVASFYAMFALEKRPRAVAYVCDDIACRANGAEALCGALETRLGKPGEAPPDAAATWLRSPCLGHCERGPAAFVRIAGADPVETTLTAATVESILVALGTTSVRRPDLQVGRVTGRDGWTAAPQTVAPEWRAGLRLLRRVGVVDPASLDGYRAHGGYIALRRALDIGPEGVLREVTDSRLLGRGGAAFPTGRKWEAVARSAVRPHYLVCNADESEPGTFKDRVLMEEDPFALVEAMTIAGYVTGCETGFLYIRGEYPRAASRLAHAIEQARLRGLLGEDVCGAGVRFDIQLRRGAGAYICGEETALFDSIEGLRGEPRNKPPFPVQAGLFGKPTLINNVETLVNVLDVLATGGPEFSKVGTAGSPGTKLFCVSGCAARPGLYEVPFGVTLREVIALAGGVRGGRPLQAVLLGGAAGVFVTPGELDMPLTFEGTRAHGAALGSGVVMLFDDGIDLGDIVRRIAAFFRDESCGQCVPCRIGTIRQEELVHRLHAGAPLGSVDAELSLLDDLAGAMRDASICGLGQTASGAIQTAVRKFGLFGATKS